MGAMAIITTATAPITMEPRPKFAILLAAAVALLCGGIAGLSLYASVTALPAGEILERLRSGEAVSQDQRIAAARASFLAGKVIERGRYWSDAALAASALPSREQARILDGLSVAAVVDAALESAPASPQNWARRASFQIASRDLAGARTSLETSLLLGRFAPGLTVPRLSLMIRLAQLAPDPSLDRRIEEQIRIAARTEPADLVRLADGGAAEGIAQRTLAKDFTLYQIYLKNLVSARAMKAAAAKRAATR